MKAAVYNSYGPPHVVKLADLDVPVPKPSEMLIKVEATTVNRTDTGFRSAEYVVSRLFSGIIRPKFPVLGNEFAGYVVKAGAEVKEFKEGDRVFGYNDASFGAHAEYITVGENDAVALIPDNLSYREAAPLTEGAHYALCDIRAAKVRPGQDVLVYGATGAIGSAAVQLLRYFGAGVTAVCHTKHVGLVASLGADKVIDYVNEDFTATEQRFDFIFDAVGKSSFGQCKRILKPKGIYVSTEPGKNGENIYLAILKKFSGGKRVIFPIPSITRHDVIFLGELAKKGIFKPLIDRQYRLDEIVEAHRYVETGQKTGNVVILP
ncbi:MAG: NADPH:quinone oxidoreductase [Cytophagaceae bacterium SCN 52-12]|nr:MAG: NADPH:quinone oxidoreductase [Cytophagaceae bacterium SCN 52-12]